MDCRSVHRYVATTPRTPASAGPSARTPLRRAVGTVGLNHDISLRDVQRLLRHAHPGDHPDSGIGLPQRHVLSDPEPALAAATA